MLCVFSSFGDTVLKNLSVESTLTSSNIVDSHSAKFYGAKGDGSDATAAIQAALDACDGPLGLQLSPYITATNFTYVRIPTGIYGISSELLVKHSYTRVVGDGTPGTILRWIGSPSTNAVIRFFEVSHCSLENILVDGTNCYTGVFLDLAEHFYSDHLKIWNPRISGMVCSRMWESDIRDLEINGVAWNSQTLPFPSAAIRLSNLGAKSTFVPESSGCNNTVFNKVSTKTSGCLVRQEAIDTSQITFLNFAGFRHEDFPNQPGGLETLEAKVVLTNNNLRMQFTDGFFNVHCSSNAPAYAMFDIQGPSRGVLIKGCYFTDNFGGTETNSPYRYFLINKSGYPVNFQDNVIDNPEGTITNFFTHDFMLQGDGNFIRTTAALSTNLFTSTNSAPNVLSYAIEYPGHTPTYDDAVTRNRLAVKSVPGVDANMSIQQGTNTAWNFNVPASTNNLVIGNDISGAAITIDTNRTIYSLTNEIGNVFALNNIALGVLAGFVPQSPMDLWVNGTYDPVEWIHGVNATDSLTFRFSHPGASVGFGIAGGNGAFFAEAQQHDMVMFGQPTHNILLGIGSSTVEMISPGNVGVAGDVSATGNITATNSLRLAIQSGMTAPISGLGILWNSNNVLYWITSTKTNPISDGR